MGFGMAHQRVEGVTTPLRARAFVVESPEGHTRFAFVNAELWGITQSVHLAVLERLETRHSELGFSESNLMLTATHTHSGPGGYSHHLLFNLSVAGYVHPIFEAIVDGICTAILQAVERLAPGHVSLQHDEIPADKPVGINRAMRAYNSNSDVTPLPAAKAHLAIDREMTTLRFESAQGRPLGAVNWFGVHACNLHADNHYVHPDNKGFASRALERHARSVWEAEDFEAAFPQTSAGDVTPNFRWDAERKLAVGACAEDIESAEHNGDLQFEQARVLWEACGESDRLGGTLRASLRYVDFSRAPVAADLGPGYPGAHTGPAVIGIAMALGTAEGPGPLYHLAALTRFLNGCRWAYQGLLSLFLGRKRVALERPHANKFPMLQAGLGARGRFLGLFSQRNAPIPDAIDPTVARLRALAKKGALGERPWTPTCLPLQIVQLGRLAVVAVPFEPTTVAARRIKTLVASELSELGVMHVVVSGYANAYAGYMTTHEEYALQGYEGASTYMGKWTLAATLTQLREMSATMRGEPSPPAPVERPRPFSEAELSVRAFEPSVT